MAGRLGAGARSSRPSEAEVLDSHHDRAGARTILGARGRALVAAGRGPVRHRPDPVAAAAAADSARRLGRLVGIDVAPYVKQVEAAGDKAFVEAIVFREDEVPTDVAAGYEDDPRRARRSADDCRWRRPATSPRRSSAPSAR